MTKNAPAKIVNGYKQLRRLETFLDVVYGVLFVIVCLFLFFAIADPTLQSISSPVGQSICLALSGFIGVASWSYARQNGLVKTVLTKTQKDDVRKSVLIEPTTALLNSGLGFVGPGSWILGWFVIPLVLVGARKLLERAR